MTAKIDIILEAARQHCNEVIRPGVDSWNEAAEMATSGL